MSASLSKIKYCFTIILCLLILFPFLSVGKSQRRLVRINWRNLFVILFSMDLNQPLQQSDPELFALIEEEKKRQTEHIELIASEVISNFFNILRMTDIRARILLQEQSWKPLDHA